MVARLFLIREMEASEPKRGRSGHKTRTTDRKTSIPIGHAEKMSHHADVGVSDRHVLVDVTPSQSLLGDTKPTPIVFVSYLHSLSSVTSDLL